MMLEKHIYVIDRGWMSYFTSGGVPEMHEEYVERLMCSISAIVEETKDKRIEELGERMAELAGQLHQFIDQHDNIEVVYPSGTFSARCVDYIQHLVNHGTYHRGNVTAMLRQLGHAGTPTDYGYYLYTLSQ
ncbi:damage-inducible protein DinB [Paenibacillus albidus]|nr:DinB family protein [Paenibacillus albidus]MBT2292127.1 damage-inducible protein DinB [Paenibacillus albidus]